MLGLPKNSLELIAGTMRMRGPQFHSYVSITTELRTWHAMQPLVRVQMPVTAPGQVIPAMDRRKQLI